MDFEIKNTRPLNQKKYGEPTGQMVGVISEIDDSEGYRLVKVIWAGERERTNHRPLDLNLVEK